MLNETNERTTMLAADRLYHEFQTLWKLENWTVHGYEAFLRHANRINPEKFFQAARDEERLFEFDTLSIIKAINSFSTTLKSSKLFLNVYPSTVIHHEFPRLIKSMIKEFPLVIKHLVFELNEIGLEEEIWCQSIFKERIVWLKTIGISIAIDDVGKGGASLQKVIDFKPDYIKLDRYFSKSLSESVEKQKMISLIVDYCKSFEIQVILEGLETPTDLAIAKKLNVGIGQGYVIGKPLPLETLMNK